MSFIPLMLLALASGVFLLMEVQSKGLSRLYKQLSWLVIVLSLLFLTAGVVHGVIHHHRMARFRHERGEFFRGHGDGQHYNWGPRFHDWKDKQGVPADSTSK